MADLTTPAGPLDAWAATFAALAPTVLLTHTPVAQAIIRTDDPGVITALELPAACRIRQSGSETAIWLGPDEWLLTCAGRTGHDWVAELRRRADGGAAYVLDNSGQRVRLTLDGPHAETILRHGCAVDLSPETFGEDDVVQTLLAQAGVIVHRDGDGFALFVRTSFAHYLAEWLVDATTEYRQPQPVC